MLNTHGHGDHMQWWVVRNAGGTFVIAESSRSSAASAGAIVAGPFATQAEAQRAMSSAPKNTSGNTGNSVVDAILATTSNLEVREAMLLGSHLESGWNPTAVGDQGTSFGPFQMHIGGALTAQGGTAADAENPTWAAQHMLGYYEQGVNSVPASLWASNPELAAEEAAVKAEGPATTYYISQGKTAVDSAWTATKNALNGIVSSSGSPGNTGAAGSAGGTTTTAATGGFWQGFWSGLLGSSVGANFSPQDALERLGLIVLGGLLILLGIYMLAGRQTMRLVQMATPEGRLLGATNTQGPQDSGSNAAGIRADQRRQNFLRNREQAEGASADEKGTSPEFRKQFLGE